MQQKNIILEIFREARITTHVVMIDEELSWKKSMIFLHIFCTYRLLIHLRKLTSAWVLLFSKRIHVLIYAMQCNACTNRLLECKIKILRISPTKKPIFPTWSHLAPSKLITGNEMNRGKKVLYSNRSKILPFSLYRIHFLIMFLTAM